MIRLFLLNESYSILYRRRSGGMADASDSKSDVGDYVWVQVPSPALMNKNRKSRIMLKFRISGSLVYLKQ